MTSFVVLLFVFVCFYNFSTCRILKEKDLNATSHLFPYGRIHFEEILMKLNSSLPKRKKKLQFETSSNIFIENLHVTRALETVHYVTDDKQMTDFFWFRDSGVRINVGLQNVQVIPHYKEIDHLGDSEFELTKPVNRDPKADWLKRSFAKIVQNLCRNPIPESYRINLEIFKDRLTTAKSEICDLAKKEAGQCPDSVGVGEEFVRRSLDEPCLRLKINLSTYPSRLSSANNSVVCQSDTKLFTDVFQLQATPLRPSYPDSKRCKAALQMCQRCLNHDHCQTEDEIERSCCQGDCYSLLECKTAFSSRCNHPIIDCASGDVHRFTVQPIFHLHSNHSSSYKCHLKRIYPSELYQVWFYVTVPSNDPNSNVSFETPRIHFRAKLNDKTRQFQFLTFEHGFGIGPEKDDVILEAEVDLERIVEEEGERRGRFKITSSQEFLKLFHGDAALRPRVATSNNFARDIRFTRPFAYSTSTWSNDGCDKDMSLIASVETTEDVDGPLASRQDVNAMIEGAKTQPEYLLKSVDNPPFIKLSVPGSWSVMRWWFSREKVFLLFSETLRISVISEDSNRFWKFFLSGRMSSCPGYLGLTINDLTEFEEVSKLDLLISCPSTFYLVIHLPNWSHKNEKTFEVVLDDAQREYRVYLSSIRLELESRNEISTTAPSGINNHDDLDGGHLTSLMLCLAITSWIVYVVFGIAARSNVLCRRAEKFCDDSTSVKIVKSGEEIFIEYRKTSTGSRVIDCCVGHDTKGVSACHGRFLLCYFVFRVVCIFLFTFTAVCSTAYFWFFPTFDSTGPTDVNCSQIEFNFTNKERREKFEKEVGLCENYVEDLMTEMKSISSKLKEFSDDYIQESHKFPSGNVHHEYLEATLGHYSRDFENSLKKKFSVLTSSLELNSKIMKSSLVSNPFLSYLKILIKQKLIFNGEERQNEELVMIKNMIVPRFLKEFNSSKRVQNYAENGHSEKFHSIKSGGRRYRPSVSVKYFSTLPYFSSQFISVEAFQEDESKDQKTIGEVLFDVVALTLEASILLPLLLGLDCSLVFIRFNRLLYIMRKIKRKNDRFFVEGPHRLQHPSYSIVVNPPQSGQRSFHLKFPNQHLQKGDDSTHDQVAGTPPNKVELLPAYETQKHSPRMNFSCDVIRSLNVCNIALYSRSWNFDEKRDHLVKIRAVSQCTANDDNDAESCPKPRDPCKEVKGQKRKGRIAAQVILKFAFVVFSTSILVSLIVVFESSRVLLMTFVYEQFSSDHVEKYTLTQQDDLSFDDFQLLSSAHFRLSSVELLEIRTFNEMIRSVYENYTAEFIKMDDRVEKFSRKLELLDAKKKHHSFTASFQPSMCLRRLDNLHRSTTTLICACSHQEDVEATHQSQASACQWNFVESAKQFSNEFLGKNKMYLVVCTSIVWFETIVRIIFVYVSKKIQFTTTDQNPTLRLNSKFALKSDMDEIRSNAKLVINQRLNNHLALKSKGIKESKNEPGDLFIIELNKSLNSNDIITDDLNDFTNIRINSHVTTHRFSETKV